MNYAAFWTVDAVIHAMMAVFISRKSVLMSLTKCCIPNLIFGGCQLRTSFGQFDGTGHSEKATTPNC